MHAEAGKPLGRTIVEARRMRQRPPDLRDGQFGIGANEFSEALPRLLFPACQRQGGCAKAVRPDGLWMFGAATREPARGLFMTADLEMSGRDANRAEEVQRVGWVEATRDLETLDRVGRQSAVDIQPAAAVPRPDTAAIERKRSVKMDRRRRKIMRQCASRPQQRLHFRVTGIELGRAQREL